MHEDSTPNRGELEKSAIALYRKAFYDYKDRNNQTNRIYLDAIRDALILILGRSRFESMRNKIKSEYSSDKTK